MVYNSNTSIQDYAPRGSRNYYADVSSKTVEADRQQHSDKWDALSGPMGNAGSVRDKNRSMAATLNNTMDPYREYQLAQRPGYNVAYGPGENPADRERGYGVVGGFQAAMREKYQKQEGYLQVTDPLGRSTYSGGMLGGEISLIQLQQTMGELKNRAALESTAAYNRNIPPAARINRLTHTETIMERILPGVMNDARTTIIKSTMLTTRILENPWKDTREVNQYYNMQTGSWEYGRRAPDYSKMPGPELIENVIEENMLWKQNMYHGADYKEGPNTKDKTKETIKTIKETGELVTTDIGDNAFKKNKEFDKAETESGKKEAALKQEMQQTKKSGLLGLVE